MAARRTGARGRGPHALHQAAPAATGAGAVQAALKRAFSTGSTVLANLGLGEWPAALFDPSVLAEEADKWWEVAALTKVDASGNQLTSLPDSIQALKELVVLILHHNAIGYVSPAVGALEALQVLDLGSNALQSIPEDIGYCTSLRKLVVSGNPGLDSLPSSLAELVHLDTLHAAGCGLQALPASLGACTALQHVDVSMNALSSLPSTMADCTALVQLDASRNRLADLPPGLMTKWHALAVLNLRENRLHTFPTLPAGTCLHTLQLGFNALAGPVAGDALLPASGLGVLDLSDNAITELDQNLWLLTALHTLDLRNNDLNGLPPTLGFAPALTRVSLEGNPLRSIRRSLVSGSVESLKGFLRSRASEALAAACEATLAQQAGAPGTSEGAQATTYTGGAGSGSFDALHDARDATASGVLDLSGRQLPEVPAPVWAALAQLNAQAQDTSGASLGPDGKELTGGALVFGGGRSGYAGGQVQARGTDAIHTLDLSGNALADAADGDTQHILPFNAPEFLPAVTCVRLAGNAALSLLPPPLGAFTRLSVLDISDTRLRWEGLDGVLMVPDAEGGMAPAPACATLRELRASRCDLRRMPSALALCPRLAVLDLSYNSIDVEEGVDDDTLLLPSLTVLNLSNNRLSCVPSPLLALPRLSQLNLENNNISHVPPALGTASQLKALQLAGNPSRLLRPAVLAKGTPAILDFLCSRLPPGDPAAESAAKLRSQLEQTLQQREAQESAAAAAAAAAAAEATYDRSIAGKIGASHAGAGRSVATAIPAHGSSGPRALGSGHSAGPSSALHAPPSHRERQPREYQEHPFRGAQPEKHAHSHQHPAVHLDPGRYRAPVAAATSQPAQPASERPLPHQAAQQPAQPAFGRPLPHQAAQQAAPARQVAPAPSRSDRDIAQDMLRVEGQLSGGGVSKVRAMSLKRELAKLRAELSARRNGGRR